MARIDPLVRVLVNMGRQRRLNYSQFCELTKQARKRLNLRRGSIQRLPQILSEAALEKFYEIIDKTQNIQHQLMLRLLFYTAVRVNELCHIEMRHVDLGASKIFIDLGKGSKDRYVLFPDWFRLALTAHIQAHPKNVYLFESNRKTLYSTRQIERIVARYARMADLEVHPHLLRHVMLTYLTKEKLTDAQIQLISGHASKKSLEKYQHISLQTVHEDYQQALLKLKM